jgi:hypothetical protein
VGEVWEILEEGWGSGDACSFRAGPLDSPLPLLNPWFERIHGGSLRDAKEMREQEGNSKSPKTSDIQG